VSGKGSLMDHGDHDGWRDGGNPALASVSGRGRSGGRAGTTGPPRRRWRGLTRQLCALRGLPDRAVGTPKPPWRRLGVLAVALSRGLKAAEVGGEVLSDGEAVADGSFADSEGRCGLLNRAELAQPIADLACDTSGNTDCVAEGLITHFGSFGGGELHV